MFPDDLGPAETAISFTDAFADAAVAKLDALFGAGYAKANPAAFGAYLAACASNINAFMTAAATAMERQEDEALDEALAAVFEEDMRRESAPKSKGRRR
jgi:hypothetical protein